MSVSIDKHKVLEMDRELLLQEGHQCSNLGFEYKVILNYNVQFRKVEHIIRNHWNIILRKDRILGPHLLVYPEFIYRKDPTLKNRLAPGVIEIHQNRRRVLCLLMCCQVFMHVESVWHVRLRPK